MPLQVNTQPTSLTAVAFTFAVPGQQRWSVRSVFARATRAAGGVPDRAYVLTVTNGTDIVAQSPADDSGGEPGSCTITWANEPSARIAAGPDGYVVAPLSLPPLDGGYLVTGMIVNPAVGDSWDFATAWYDFTYTTAP